MSEVVEFSKVELRLPAEVLDDLKLISGHAEITVDEMIIQAIQQFCGVVWKCTED